MTDRAYDPAEMARRGRIGGLVSASRLDTRARAEHAHAAFVVRFEPAEAEDLPPEERRRRRDAAFKAHMASMTRKSLIARRQKKAAKEAA